MTSVRSDIFERLARTSVMYRQSSFDLKNHCTVWLFQLQIVNRPSSSLWIVFSLLFFKIKLKKKKKTTLRKLALSNLLFRGKCLLPSHLHLLSQDYLIKLPPDSGNCLKHLVFHAQDQCVLDRKAWLAPKLLAFFRLLQNHLSVERITWKPEEQMSYP